MRIRRDYVLRYLTEKQDKKGGYFGTDISDLAKEIGVSGQGLRIRLSKWIKEDKDFSSLIYLGKHRSHITHNEFLEIRKRIHSNPQEVKSHILFDLQDVRKVRGEKAIPRSTFYRWVNQTLLEGPLDWFNINKIKIPPQYSVENARDSLSTIFTFHGLKNYGGTDLTAIYERLEKAKECFSAYDVDPIGYYPHILTRRKHLSSLLTSIPHDQQVEIQKRLIFEIQDAFIVECNDLLISELVHRKGRIQQSMNASRQKMENHFRKEALKSIRNSLKEMVLTSSPDMEMIQSISDPSLDEETMARMELIRRYSKSYDLISLILEKFIGMREVVDFHNDDGRLFFQLATGKSDWHLLGEKDRKSLVRDIDLIRAIDNGNEDVARLLAIDHLINYIRHGKITFYNSYYYQDIGTRIKKVSISSGDEFLNSSVLEQLISGTFPVNIEAFYDAIAYADEDIDENVLPISWVDFSEVLSEVSRYVRQTIPNWFDEHNRMFRRQTDGIFSIEYNEEEFAERLYNAIGFLGRNLRYRDSEQFWNLQYFIQRYVTEETLRLELRFINHCIDMLGGRKVEAVVIDTMGIEGRKKSILASYHGRYHTIGMADLRAVAIDMTPIYSGDYRSTDSEAMNIVEVMAQVQAICGDSVRIYCGNGHTTSRVSAGMVFLSHGVVAAGRIHHKPEKQLGKSRLKRLRKNILLLNKVGKLLREEPTLGRVMAMKRHVYVEGINVRQLVEDLGYLILANVCKKDIPVDDVSLAVERSNYMKRKSRIMEGSNTRVERHGAGLLLISAELILCCAGLYHLSKGWESSKSPINLSDIRLFIPA
jgi:hypothetical protein